MLSYWVVLKAYILAWAIIYTPTLYLQAAKTLARLRRCAGMFEHLLLAYAINSNISWAGNIDLRTNKCSTSLYIKTIKCMSMLTFVVSFIDAST